MSTVAFNPGTTARRTVLVVDDEPGIRTALAAHFAREGWQVMAASGVHEAEHRLRQGEFDLLVSDVRLPDGSGAELLRASQGTPVVLMSAYATVADAVEAMRCGARDYLTKPVDWAQVRAAAERFAGSAGAVEGGVAGAMEESAEAPADVAETREAPQSAPAPMRELERLHLQRALELTRGNRTHAAEMLGISLRTVRNKIREYGLPPRRYA